MLLRFAVRLLVPLLLLAAAAVAQDDDAATAQRDLEKLRERLQSLEQEIAADTGRRDAIVADLRAAERAAAKGERQLAELRAQLEATRGALADLKRQQATGRQELSAEVATLQRQLRAAWVTGRQEWLRLVLSGEDPQQTGRQLVYYSYLSRARAELVSQVRERLAVLIARAERVAGEQRKLASLENQQAARGRELAGHRNDRARTLARLDQRIEGQAGELSRLQSQAAQLEALVARLNRAIADLAVNDAAPFASRKGGMAWPAPGKALHRFGQPRADGQLRWDGTLLGAPAGSEVQAIHHGRVVFADWLPGLGLLAVVDHGDGYLSLYGHNRDLVKDVGDWVASGEVLAHVGDSGGRAEAGLYFEIRRNGRPIDPRPWMR